MTPGEPLPLDPRIVAAYAVDPALPSQPLSPRALRVGPLVVKSFGPEEVAEAAQEALILQHLAGGGGYRVQEIVRTRTNAPWHRDAVGALLATRWEPGAVLDHGAISDGRWGELGATLAALHRRLESADAPRPGRRLGDSLRGRDLAAAAEALAADRAFAAGRSDGAEARAVLAAQARLLARWGRERPPADWDDGRFVHHDFNQHNYLFRDGVGPFVVDWGRALGAPREFEVVRTLAHLPVTRPSAARAFLAGYLAVRPLARAALPTSLAAMLTEHAVKRWPFDRWRAGEPEALPRIAALAPVVVALADRGERLADFYDEALARAGC